jgi:hypothetical protein
VERIELVVHGDGVGTLPRAFDDVPEDDRELYDGDGFVVAVTENKPRWEETEVTATTVMEMTGETRCEVTIITGGGGYGLMNVKHTGEPKEARNIEQRLETFCEEHDLTVERV